MSLQPSEYPKEEELYGLCSECNKMSFLTSMCKSNSNSPICYICWNGIDSKFSEDEHSSDSNENGDENLIDNDISEYSFDYEQVKSFEEEETMFTFTDETKLSFQEEQPTHPNVDSLE